MNWQNVFLERLYQHGSKPQKSQEPVRTINREDNGTDINAIEKYYVVKS